MTDKKLYYTDPLAAAYMSREFGIKIYANQKCTCSYEQPRDIAGDVPNFYIHPDDCHIFEPQVGDKDEDGFRFENGAWVRIEMNGYIIIIDADESDTARRNNKPFFWPEGGV